MDDFNHQTETHNGIIEDIQQSWVQKCLNMKGKGSSVLEAAQTNVHTFNPSSTLFQMDLVNLSDVIPEYVPGIPEGMTGIILHGVLTSEECSALISSTPFEGPGFYSTEDIQRLYRGRIVERYVSEDEPLSRLIFERISSHLPRQIDSLSLHGIAPDWRFLRYSLGGNQACHIDGREKRGEKIESRLTVQMYLNSCTIDYKGGEIVFLDSEYSEKLKYCPQARGIV